MEPALRSVRRLARLRPKRPPAFTLLGQPFDGLLLAKSALYRRSRQAYLDQGGKFRGVLVSSPRGLGSPILLENRIEYSPIEEELIWAASDPIERKNHRHFATIRTFATSVFHEQSHRLLWKFLKEAGWRCPSDREGARKYLNLIEGLVVALDMALGDELGASLAHDLYQSGAIYNPGTNLRQERLSKRQYRNYLQAAVVATYLTLEGYGKPGIRKLLRAQFPQLGALATRVADRACRIDPLFVEITNPTWQERHARKLVRVQPKGGKPLVLPDQPHDQVQAYVLGEAWFAQAGL